MLSGCPLTVSSYLWALLLVDLQPRLDFCRVHQLNLARRKLASFENTDDLTFSIAAYTSHPLEPGTLTVRLARSYNSTGML